MKLHLPKTLLVAVLAASGIVSSHALAVTYTATCTGDGTFLHNYTFTDEAAGTTAAWDVAAANNSSAILHFTSGSYGTANTVAKVQYNTFSTNGFIVDANTNVSGIGCAGTRNFIVGHANQTSSSQINRDFELSPNNGLALAGTQTWTVADNVTFSLKDSNVTNNGAVTLNGEGIVDFTSHTLNGSGSMTVSSGTVKNVTLASGSVTVAGGALNTATVAGGSVILSSGEMNAVTLNSGSVTVSGGALKNVTMNSGSTLILSADCTLSGVTISNGSVLDLTGLELTADTPLVSSSEMTISEGTTISLSGVTAGSTVAISDTALNGINFVIDGEEIVAARSTITQNNGSFTFESLGHIYSDMVWAGGESGTWNTTDANWTSAASGSASPIAFANDDSVTFNSTAEVTVAEDVAVGGMSVTGSGTVLDLSVSNNGYVRGDVTVSDGAKLVLKTTTDSAGLIRGAITVNAGSTLQLDAKDVTGWGGNADATQSIRIEEGAQLLLNHRDNETFRGQLTLNGTMKGLAADGSAHSPRWDFYGGSSSLVVEAGKTAKVENVTLMLRQDNSRITVNEGATLTVGIIDNKVGDQEGNGIFNKLGSGAMNVTGSAAIYGVSLEGGSLSFSGGGSLGNITMTHANTALTLAGTSETTYTVSTLTASHGTITLGSGSHTFSMLDLSNGGGSNAQMTVQSGGHLTAATLWGCSHSSILLEEGATFTSGAVVVSGVASENKSKVQATANALYSLGNANYTISDATVTVNSANAVTIANTLVGGSLINVGGGEVTTTNGWNNLKKIEARGGNINVQWFDVQGALDTLVIAEGKTVAAHTKDDPLASVEHEATLIVTNVATFGPGATLNANLDLRSGVTLTLNGALQMGSSLTLNSGMTLQGDKLAELGALTFGSTVELFTGVDTLVLGDQSYTMGTDTLGETDAIDLHTYFSNVQSGSYYLGYDASGVVYAGRLVPEPATATLGLLALAGLCARRRRK